MSNIGHNNPPDPIDQAIAPFADYIEEAQNWLDGQPVENDDQLAATDALLKSIKGAIKALKEARDASTKPLHDAWKTEVARWKPTADDLDRISASIVAAQDPYKRALAAQREIEKRAAWEAAERAKREAMEAARAAQASDIAAQRDAAEKAAVAQEAAKAALAKSKDTVKGMRTTHKYEIEDHRAALNWIAKNHRGAITDFIETFVCSNHKSMDIDGVKQWTQKEAF
jgi:chromosome segregation ATPase